MTAFVKAQNPNIYVVHCVSRLVHLTPGRASSQLIVKTEVLSQYFTILI